MIVEKRIKQSSLWDWLKKNLPQSLVAVAEPTGYGFVYEIYQRDQVREHGLLFFKWSNYIGEPVATVSGLTVELFHPQYFSDFEDLIRRFENETESKQVLLTFWQSP